MYAKHENNSVGTLENRHTSNMFPTSRCLAFLIQLGPSDFLPIGAGIFASNGPHRFPANRWRQFLTQDGPNSSGMSGIEVPRWALCLAMPGSSTYSEVTP